ncbi:ATP-binding cassette domain-containing protein [[Mycoplasma] cavipharyngis]|uniref:ATP-binding cassette domain-containing protein n=1 Tax=[Mycoplasma] cavipharyngis TaxID=92757 RepID=UPI003704C0DE
MKYFWEHNHKLIYFTLFVFLGLIFGLINIWLKNLVYQNWTTTKNLATNELNFVIANQWKYDLNYLFNKSGQFLSDQFLLQRNRFSTNDADIIKTILHTLDGTISTSSNSAFNQINLDRATNFVTSFQKLSTVIQLFAFFSWLAIIVLIFNTIFYCWNLAIAFSKKNPYLIYSYSLIYFFNFISWIIVLILWKLYKQKHRWIQFETISKLNQYWPFLWIKRINDFFLKFNDQTNDPSCYIEVKNLSFTYHHGHKWTKHLLDTFKLSVHEKEYSEETHIFIRKKLIKFINKMMPFVAPKPKNILTNLNFKIAKGSFTTIIGPNGSGKSTLIKTLLGIERHYFGTINWNQKNLHRIQRRSFAQNVAYFPQILDIPEGINVYDFVAFGVIPHQDLSGEITQAQQKNIYDALLITNTLKFADKKMNQLSGGQRQSVILATILAQQTDTIILDEPTTYLDLNNQNLLLTLLKKLQKNGKTIIMILHDLNQAINYSDNLIILKDGTIYNQGSPKTIINQKLLQEVFQVKAKIELINNIPHLYDFDVNY